MKVNSINIRNTAKIKHTPTYNPQLATVEDYENFIINTVSSSVDGHRIIMIQFAHLETTVVIEEVDLSDKESCINVRYTNHNKMPLEIYKNECFFYDFGNDIYFPKEDVITAINNQLMKDNDFVVFPNIDYNSICNF